MSNPALRVTNRAVSSLTGRYQANRADRRVIAVMRQRLQCGEPVVPMYGPLGLAWLQRQAEVAEDLVAERQTIERHTD